MELEKSFNNGYGYITILNGKKKLTIEYAPNLDLYFVVEDTSEFVITKEDYQIYELFSKLYETSGAPEKTISEFTLFANSTPI